MVNHQPVQPTLAIACGGTGGHFFPGLAIAREFNQLGGQSWLFIAGQHREEQLELARREGITGILVDAVRLPVRKWGWPVFGVKFFRAVVRHRQLLCRYHINRALVMGSFASAPLGFATLLTRNPLFIHEGNSIMGKSNKMLSRWASQVLLSFPDQSLSTSSASRLFIGMPIRQTMIDAGDREWHPDERISLCRELKLKPEQPILMVFGGSQGAHFINSLIQRALMLYSPGTIPFQLIHLTGQEDNTELMGVYQKHGLTAVVKKFTAEIDKFLRLADYIICRAGGSTIFELAHLGKAALYIPLASAMDNHQQVNARYLVENEAGLMLEEKECTPDKLKDHLQRWCDQPEVIAGYGRNAKRLARPHAAAEAAKIIFTYRRN